MSQQIGAQIALLEDPNWVLLGSQRLSWAIVASDNSSSSRQRIQNLYLQPYLHSFSLSFYLSLFFSPPPHKHILKIFFM